LHDAPPELTDIDAICFIADQYFDSPSRRAAVKINQKSSRGDFCAPPSRESSAFFSRSENVKPIFNIIVWAAVFRFKHVDRNAIFGRKHNPSTDHRVC
jgi:hypothetical protein